jgi:cation:H+ antiporter
MAILESVGIILLTSAVIYYAGKYFTQASSDLGDHLHLPRSVKGATFDAISSSLPELLVALYAVLFFNQFEVGIGTIVGSALFNLLIIPGICVLVAPVAFKVSKQVVSREAVFYIISVIALIIALLASSIWGLIIPLIFITIYAIYIFVIYKDVKHHRKITTKKIINGSPWMRGLIIAGTVIIIGIATYFLTEHAILFSELIKVHPFIIAFTVIAGATSVPDAVISIINAKKGDIDDATSNVFGSNSFDILVGLSIPLIIAYFLIGPTTIVFQRMELIGALFVSTLIVYLILVKKRMLTKKHGWLLLGMYGVILAYVIYISSAGII